MWRFSDHFYRNLRPGSHERGALQAHYSNRSRTERPSSVRVSPCQLHFLRYSCHRQLYLIPFAARRTARRGSFLLLLSSSSYVIFRFLFFTFFSKPVKKNPYTTKALLFYVLVSHVNPKNSTGLSLSVEFFPSIPFLKRFLPLLWHLKTGFSLAFPGISPQAIQTL